jgi:lipid A 3-O-deacylase
LTAITTVSYRHMLRSGICAISVSLLATSLLSSPAAADENGRITAIEENDSILFDSDRYYTQGLQFSYLGGDLKGGSGWNAPFDFLSDNLSIFPSEAATISRHYEILFGQQIFTPANTSSNPPDPADRPYAGWLYTGLGLIQDTDRRQLDHLELLLGVVGPAALGRQVQNDWHQLIGDEKAQGWDSQLHNEPGVMLSYEHKWRFLQPFDNGFAVDAIPEVGGTVGNVMTYGEIATMFRFGKNLEADYGPQRMRPALSGTSYFNSEGLEDPFGFYFYVGAQGRVVGRNIFLDGNTFRDSEGVNNKKIFVADLVGGLSLFWSSAVKFDMNVTYRTKEYDHQDKDEKYAGFNLSFGL